ncbi:unnamed protein product, partial [marine sediment metagenome]
EILPYLKWFMDPFEVLEFLMKGRKIDTIIANSVPNIQRLTGIEEDKIDEEALAIYTKGEIYLFSPFKMVADHLKMTTYENPKNVLKELGGGNTGVEEKSLSLYQYERLGLGDYKMITSLLRKWRERTAINDLIYYIIAAKSMEYAIRKSLNYAHKNVFN